jgi:hypothetical protein
MTRLTNPATKSLFFPDPVYVLRAGAAEFLSHFKSKKKEGEIAESTPIIGGVAALCVCVAFSFSGRRDLLSPHPSIMSRVESTVSLSSSDVLSVSPARISVHTKSKRLKRASFSPLTCVCATARSYYSLLLLHGRVDFNFFFPLSAAIIFSTSFVCVCLRPKRKRKYPTNKQTNKQTSTSGKLFVSFLFVLRYTPIMSACSRLLPTRCNALFFDSFSREKYRMCIVIFVFLFFLSFFLFLPLRTCFCRTC